MITQCPYCNMTTTGEHESNCPSYNTVGVTGKYCGLFVCAPDFPIERYISPPVFIDWSKGWLCPRCKAVNAPWVQQCTCRDDPC